MSCKAGRLFWFGVVSSIATIAMTQIPTEIAVTARTFRTEAIVHGDNVVSITRWPWQVFIELDNGNNQCGGTLISNQWILTAAHCFDGGKKATNIVMGTTSRSLKFGLGVIGIVDIVCCHQKYNTKTLDYDICLIKLAKAMDQTVHIDWLRLPTAGSELVNGAECHITGWGYNEKLVLPDILQEATVKIVERQTCIAWHKPHNTVVVNNTVCAGHEFGGADSCGGDSGGPMVCRNFLGDYILEGITSYGPSFCGAAKLPGIYTKVSAYIDWIQEKMNNPCLRTEWSQWSGGCSVTCGVGTSSKTRICLNDVGQQIDSSLCNGRSEEKGLCIQKPCPTYAWSEWTEGTCSKTCGDAVRTDQRYCTAGNGTRVNPERCTGSSTKIANCSLSDCPAWSEWAEGICSKTCGDAVRTDVRYCTGDDGTRVNPERCTGSSTRVANCVLPDCPVPHFWGPWSSVCSVTCGEGVRTRIRECKNSLGQTTSEISRCYPGLNTVFDSCQLTACTGISWGEWGPWSSCQYTAFTSCLGISYSTRTCSLSGLITFRGFCSGDYQRTRHCAWRACSPQELAFLRQSLP